MKALVRHQPFWSFYVLAVLLSVFANSWMFGLAPNVGQLLNDQQLALGPNHFRVIVPLSLMFSHPLLIPAILFPSAPSLSAIVVTAIRGGGAAVKTLLSRFKPWRGNIAAKQAGMLYAEIFAGTLVVIAGLQSGRSEPRHLE